MTSFNNRFFTPRRISARFVASHLAFVYFSHDRDPLHDPSDEPLAHAEFSFDFERMPLTKQALRELLTSEMLCFHPEIANEPPPPAATAGGGAASAMDEG